VDVGEIVGRESLKVWFESLPATIGKDKAREWTISIAHRAAMRGLLGYLSFANEDHVFRADVNRAKVFRAALIGQLFVAGAANTDGRTAAIAFRVAGDAARSASRDEIESSAKAYLERATNPNVETSIGRVMPVLAASGISNTGLAILRSDLAEAMAFASTIGSQVEHDDAAREQLQRDCRAALVSGIDSFRALWAERNPYADLWSHTQIELLSLSSNWRFWVDWYDKALNGEAQDWDLLTKVALIPSEDWNKGADYVNAVIAQIVEQHRLVNEARLLKEEIEALRAELELLKHRGHNGPPSLVEETEAAQRQITVLWAALDEAETELEKQEPDASVLKRIAQTLWAAVKSVGLYCAKLGDTALQGAAGAAGAGIVAYGSYLATQNQQVQGFAEWLLQFAQSLGG